MSQLIETHDFVQCSEDQLAELLTLEPTMTQSEQEYFLRLGHRERALELEHARAQRRIRQRSCDG